jgi:hypothetical protein
MVPKGILRGKAGSQGHFHGVSRELKYDTYLSRYTLNGKLVWQAIHKGDPLSAPDTRQRAEATLERYHLKPQAIWDGDKQKFLPLGKHLYVGIKAGKRIPFSSETTPTEQSHGKLYDAVIGPFETVRGQNFMVMSGRNNPHCQTVADAERISKAEKPQMTKGRGR